MSFAADVVTLFPEVFPGPLGASVIGRGLAEGLWTLRTTQLRDFAADRHRTVDDTPAGGGPGMVLKPDILAMAIDAVSPPGVAARMCSIRSGRSSLRSRNGGTWTRATASR